MSIQQPKILCLFSAPLVAPDGKPLDALDVKSERDTIVRELSACRRKISLRIEFATIDELARGVTDKFNILHLSGHGNQDFLVFEDGKSGSHPVKGDYLERLIGAGGPFELAVVSACHSEKIAEMLVQAGVPHVIAIRCDTPVLDRAATTFIRQFYRNLFCRDSLQKAFEMASLLVEGDPQLEKIKPQLEFIAHEKGEPFIPEEKKFVLLPRDSPHSNPLFSEEIPEGTLSIEELTLSKTNLPARPQYFTGRSREMHAIINELLANRFVTATGTGGIGKTTVATEVARWFHSRGYFPDGVFRVDLRRADTAEGVMDMIATALDIQVAEPRDVIEHLRERQCLLLLDNAEEVLWKDEDAVQEVINSILKFAAQTKLLITSQRPVGGNPHEIEHVCRIFPLEKHYAAFLFFLTKNREISKQEWESNAFHDLLEQLGGHPLSIILMARQFVQGTTLEDLIERIKTFKAKAIRVKGITDRDREHGESLVASLASAYDNVSEYAKTLFGILSMLPAGAQDFTLKGIFGSEAWEYAQELNDASLAEITFNRRVVLLPPVRLFALTVLTNEIKEQYGPGIMALMASYAKQFYEHLGAKDAKEHRFFFALEEPNLRSAIELPCAPPTSDKEGSVLGFLASYLISLYISHYRYKEAREVGVTLISNLEKLQDELGEASTLMALGDLAMRTDDLKGAQQRYEKALEIFQQVDEKLGEANTLMALGDLAMRTDDLKGAQQRYEKALEIFQQVDAKLGEASTLKALGDLAMRTDDLKGAQQRYEKALEIFQQVDEKLGEASTLMALGDLAMRTADLKGAQQRYEKALEIFQQVDEKLGEASTLMALGDLAMRTADLKGAQQRYEKALEIFQQVDEKLGEANTLMALGDLAMRTDDLKGAQQRYEKALEIFQQVDAKLGEASTLKALGDLAMRTDDLKGAQQRYEKALEIFQQVDEKLGEANTLMRLGQWLTITDNLNDAEIKLENAVTIYKRIEDLEGQADVHMGKALIHLKRHDITKARNELDQCSSIRDTVLAHGEAAQWPIFYANHLKLRNFPEGVRICLEYAGKFAFKAQDQRLQDEVKRLLNEVA